MCMLIARAPSSNRDFGQDARSLPEWLDTSLAYNYDHLARHGHKLVISEPNVEYFDFQREWCAKTDNPDSEAYKECLEKFTRDNGTWKKFDVILKHLTEDDAKYILFIDVDAVFASPNIDVVSEMIGILEEDHKDLMLANEDWRTSGESLINTGVILARNCPWTKQLFSGLLAMQLNQTCKRNEQLCLNGMYQANRMDMQEHILVGSGSVWNRHPKASGGPFAPVARISHFMGGAKSALVKIDTWSCGHCACALGVCSHGRGGKGACLNTTKCAAQNQAKQERFAIVIGDPLSTSKRNFNVTKFRLITAMAAENKYDVLLMVPDKAKFPLNDFEISTLEELTIIVRTYSTWGAMDGTINRHLYDEHYIALQSFSLREYDAVVYIDKSVAISTTTLEEQLKCAARGRFIASAGPDFPLDGRIFAVKPSIELFSVAMTFLKRSKFSESTGWDGAGWYPAVDPAVRRVDGLIWTLFYNNGAANVSQATNSSFSYAGIDQLLAYEIDPSAWQAYDSDGVALFRTTRIGCDITGIVSRRSEV